MICLKYIGCHFIEGQDFIIDQPHGSGDYLFLLFHSEVYMKLNGKITLLKPGALILLSPETNYCYYNKLHGFDNDWFHFTDPGFNIFITDLRLPINTPFYLNDILWVHKTIQSIERENLLKEIGYRTQVSNLISGFFILLSRKREQDIRPYSDTLELQFKDLRSRILTNISNKWTIDEMCGSVFLSRSRFSFLYKSFFGISPKEDLLTERFNMACYLLTSTGSSISFISQKVGYNNIYHFSKQFKSITNLSPRAYRNKHRLQFKI